MKERERDEREERPWGKEWGGDRKDIINKNKCLKERAGVIYIYQVSTTFCCCLF